MLESTRPLAGAWITLSVVLAVEGVAPSAWADRIIPSAVTVSAAAGADEECEAMPERRACLDTEYHGCQVLHVRH
jgi:hypothetical protein